MCDNRTVLKTRHSYHIAVPSKSTRTDVLSKSEFTLPTTSITSRSSNGVSNPNKSLLTSKQGDYYKKYEHDELPVKDSDDFTNYEGAPIHSITNSEIDNLEKRIYKNVSQELQTDEGSLSSLESNIKFFKTTVEKIFENFYTSMSDFEHYKKRFYEILDKCKEGSNDDMEDFIKDMFEHIMSSDNLASNNSRQSTELTGGEGDDKERCVSSSSVEPETDAELLEEYKNEHYVTDSEENCTKIKKISKIEEIFNITLLGGSPYVEIKLDGRNLFSEISIKPPNKAPTGSIASADNLKKLAAKRLQLEKYIHQQNDNNLPDREIPIKVSNAKKNIYLNEDFAHTNENNEKSFLSKICNLICKKFRRNTLS